MKRQIGILGAVAMFGIASLAGAQAEPKLDLTGKWAFTVVYEGGSGSPVVTLTQKGDSLSGRYSSQAFGELDVKGTVKGREFSFWFTTSAGGDPFTMTYNGVIEGTDALKGTADLGGNGTATFTARRQKDPDPVSHRGARTTQLQVE